MRIGLIQLNITDEVKQRNHERAESFLEQAAQKHCDIAVLPELFDTGFIKNIKTLAASAPNTPAVLVSMARAHQINLIAGFAQAVPDSDKVHSILAAYDRSGALIAEYTKIHPFSYGKEDRYFIPGTQVITCEIDNTPSGLFICYDLRFPEIFRTIAKTVHLIFVIANWPTSRKDHWISLLKARAIENQCFVIGVNRTGANQQGLPFPGASHIFDPFGKTICSGNDSEELIIADIDLNEVTRIRKTYPFLQDMRPFKVRL